MIGRDLFQRFFLRFLLSLVIAFLLFLPLVHIFQKRVMISEMQEDLRQQAHWLAIHSWSGENTPMLANAWGITHSTLRLTIFDTEGMLLADSQPENTTLNLEELKQGRYRRTTLAAFEEMRGGGWLVVSRPAIPAFPSGIQWELIGAAAFIVALVTAFLYPFVRSMSLTLKQLTEIA
ncbi:MAG: hypothetical protein O7G85_04680 [Planctomycetota bacterium]|nr:hypothetical protein [Planctomycetota bacterium]